LRTVADGCERLRPQTQRRANTPSTPRPPEWNGNPCYAFGKNMGAYLFRRDYVTWGMVCFHCFVDIVVSQHRLKLKWCLICASAGKQQLDVQPIPACNWIITYTHLSTSFYFYLLVLAPIYDIYKYRYVYDYLQTRILVYIPSDGRFNMLRFKMSLCLKTWYPNMPRLDRSYIHITGLMLVKQ